MFSFFGCCTDFVFPVSQLVLTFIEDKDIYFHIYLHVGFLSNDNSRDL